MNSFLDFLKNPIEINLITTKSKQSLQKYHKVIAHLSPSTTSPKHELSHTVGTPRLISSKVKKHKASK